MQAECQVCGKETDDFTDDREVLKDWCVHHIAGKGGSVDILTCKSCDRLRVDEILEGYKQRIRAGFDISYH